MRKVFSLTLILSSLIYSEVNWEREQICPLPDPTFVNNLMKTMSLEEKVGQEIQADLDFIKPSDLRDYPIGSVLNGGNTSPRGKLRASSAEAATARLAACEEDEGVREHANRQVRHPATDEHLLVVAHVWIGRGAVVLALARVRGRAASEYRHRAARGQRGLRMVAWAAWAENGCAEWTEIEELGAVK